MKNNKLLLSTALISSMFAAGTVAHSAVSGSVEYTFNSAEDTASDTEGALGSEETVKFSGSKDGDLGTITTSFKLEDAAIEAPVISITSGDTTVGLGADFAPNLSFTNIPTVGDRACTVGKNIGSAAIETVCGGATIKNAVGILFAQKFDGGAISAFIVPDIAVTQGGGGDSSNTVGATTGGSAMNLVISSNLGVDGLSLKAGMNDVTGKNGNEDQKSTNIGATYNFGNFSVGINRAETENLALAAAQDEYKTDSIGVGYAINDNLSVSVNYEETDGDTNGTDLTDEEETTMVSVGYNMGGLGLEISYVEIDNVLGSSASDGDAFQIRTVGKF
jgi:hypothetical protein|tara:strand:- start:11775 stop:12773 length:999 start_codon:yes stop_codon:yes gene_type:complete